MNNNEFAPIVSDELPSGIETISGGTRNTVKLSRPWQTDLPYNPDKCPFHQENDPMRVNKYETPNETWQVRFNKETPHSPHRLILPMLCWPPEKLYELGSPALIAELISAAQRVYRDEELQDDLYFGIHIGYLAGQNLGHLHAHLAGFGNVEEANRYPKILDYADDEGNQDRIVTDTDDWRVIAGMARAGECLIVRIEDSAADEDLGPIIHDLISKAGRAFMSTEGKKPEYMLGLRFAFGKVLWGYYLPILNQLGFPLHFALYGEGSLVLPWTPEKTAEYIRNA